MNGLVLDEFTIVSDTTTNDTTNDATNDTTNDATEDTSNVGNNNDKDQTTATDNPDTATGTDKKSGCGSVVGGTVVALIMLGATFACRKKDQSC